MMQTLKLIGRTITKISIPGHIRTKIERITADLVSDKMHTSLRLSTTSVSARHKPVVRAWAAPSLPFQGTATTQVVYKDCHCQWIPGPSLMEVRWHQHSHTMQPNVSTDDMIHKCCCTMHEWSGRWRLSQMILRKWSKMRHIFAHNGLPWGSSSSSSSDNF